MRIQVQLDTGNGAATGSLTIRADRYSAATPPARLAATLASILEATLTDLAVTDLAVTDLAGPDLAGPSTPAAVCFAESPTVDVAIEAPDTEAPGVPAPAPVLEAPAEVPATGMPTEVPPAEVLLAPALADVPVAAVPAGDSELVEGLQLRRTALQLLDDGLTDDQVCARLGVSRARLLRWDDPDAEFVPPPLLAASDALTSSRPQPRAAVTA